MSSSFQLEAEVREDIGKGASRRLRREHDLIPAVIYGAGKPAESITMKHNKIIHALEKESFYASIIDLKVGKGRAQAVILKALQRHPFKPKVLHLDFLRVKADEALTVNVPVHFLNEEEAPGVKESGVVSRLTPDLEVSCLPKDLPEFLELDISELELDASLHISDIKLPEGVELIALKAEEPNDMVAVTIHMPKIEVEPEPELEEGEAEAEDKDKAEGADTKADSADSDKDSDAKEKKED